MATYRCTPCGAELDRDDAVCPECGSPDRAVATDDALRLDAGFRLKARYGEIGERRPHRQQRDEIVWRVDRQRWERCIMVIDRDADYYLEEWRDLETGEVAFHKEGRLRDPEMHGESGKRGKRPDGPAT